jgi:hypothetical protein
MLFLQPLYHPPSSILAHAAIRSAKIDPPPRELAELAPVGISKGSVPWPSDCCELCVGLLAAAAVVVEVVADTCALEVCTVGSAVTELWLVLSVVGLALVESAALVVVATVGAELVDVVICTAELVVRVVATLAVLVVEC